MIFAVIYICFCGLMLLIVVYSYSIFKNLSFSLKNADKNYKPHTAVFVPCRHNFDTLKNNLLSVLNQDYDGTYRVFYIVESADDSAYQVIEEIVRRDRNSELIIAGTAVNNSQKNFNILRAIEKINNEKRNNFDVYAFFDSDHRAPRDWLAKLIATLTIKNTEISTFHSVKEPKKLFPLGNIIYSMLNNYIYGVNTFSNQAWGGSLAMRMETYKKYNIDKIWNSTVSHDCPMNAIKAKISFNPKCTPEETHYSYSLKNFIKWSTRQFTNWKHYSMNFWSLSFYSILANLIILYCFIVSLIHNLLFKSNPAVTLIIGIYIILSYMILSVFVSFKMKNNVLWFIVHFFTVPLFLHVLFISFLHSIYNRNIQWAGKKYSLGKKGIVLGIKNNIKN